jgi:hypothetical protein
VTKWQDFVVDVVGDPNMQLMRGYYTCPCEDQMSNRNLSKFMMHIRRMHQPLFLTMGCSSMEPAGRHNVGTQWLRTNSIHLEVKHLQSNYMEKMFSDLNMDLWNGRNLYRLALTR